MSELDDIPETSAPESSIAVQQASSLLVFADDWGRHPSSCQHLISRLLLRYQVAWVNTIGMRPPRLDQVTIKRAWEKLAPWTKRIKQGHTWPTNLRVVDPKMWPWFSRGHDRWLNEKMLQRGLNPVVNSLKKPVIGITTLPIVADLMDHLEVDRWVYYCVDDFSKWPGLDHQAIAEMETALVAKSDVLIAASPHLQNRLQQISGSKVELLTHGIDLEHWSVSPQDPSSQTSENDCPWLKLPQPLVVFWGLIDRRMDASLLKKLSEAMQQGTILLVGPLEQPDQSILSLPNVSHLPAMNYDQLPHLAAMADVLVMPYADLPVTQAMQPLKLKEYLCTDKPVVVRHLPAVEPWLDCLDVVENAEQFAAKVLFRLENGLDASQKQSRQRILQETWEMKAVQFESWALSFQS